MLNHDNKIQSQIEIQKILGKAKVTTVMDSKNP